MQLPDDTVEYKAYLVSPQGNPDIVRLAQVIKTAREIRDTETADHIWHRDVFSLGIYQDDDLGHIQSQKRHAEVEPNTNAINHLHGRVDFGDAVDDQWLVVHLLRQLSRRHQDLWVRVYDSYGEFLLVEAADALPDWLNPENDSHRVWIHNGDILLIPGTSEDRLSLSEALAWIADPAKKLQRSAKLQKAAFNRIQHFPRDISSAIFCSRVRIPRRLAMILHECPTAVSRAVDAFYLRDPIALQHIRHEHASRFRNPPQDLVTVSVRFTKLLFSQLQAQTFELEAPAYKSMQASSEDRKVRQQQELGLRLTCGFEMLLSDSKNVDLPLVQNLISRLTGSLPTDAQIDQWSQRDDDDSWLDMDFADLDRDPSKEAPLPRTLQEIMDRMQRDVGDEEDFSEESDSSESGEGFGDEDDAEENLDGAEEDFNKMMLEMLDMPPDVLKEMMNLQIPGTGMPDPGESDDSEDVEDHMQQTANELVEAGVFELDDSSDEHV